MNSILDKKKEKNFLTLYKNNTKYFFQQNKSSAT